MGEDSKTEKATPKKRRDERKKGNVFLSQDAVAVASLLGSVAVLRMTFGGAAGDLGRFMKYCIGLARGTVSALTPTLMAQFIVLLAQVAGPLLGIGIFMSVAATFAQTQLLVSAELLKPKFDKLNPIEGFKRLFSLNSLVTALKNLLKVLVLLYIIYDCLRKMVGIAGRYLYADLGGACRHLFGEIFTMFLKIILVFFVLAVADFFYQWWDYERKLRMSKQEIKEEFKQTEGDPQVKGRIKELQRKMAQSRMMQQVPQADVIVRNPTHIAVALRYHLDTDTAPIVLAKGLDELAGRIVSVAEQHNITVIENVPLARALYTEAELNRPIPPDLYEAVAEIMVYLYKLGRMKSRTGEPVELPQPVGPM